MLAKTQDVMVLLPGILGSELTKDGKAIWSLSKGTILRTLLSLGGSIEGLTLSADVGLTDPGDGVVATRILPDTHLLPGLWKVDGYTKVARTLCQRLGLERGKNFFEFPYDWRLDNRIAAKRLAQLAPGWLDSWRRQSGASDSQLVLVAHSMGGLVARYFVEALDGWRWTRRMITFGTPFRGAPKALDVLANGFRKLGGLFDLTAFARSLPSVHQLLPRYQCVRLSDGRVVRPGDPGVRLPGLDVERAAAGLAFYEEIDAAITRNATLPEYVAPALHPIVGTLQPTLQSAHVVDGRLEVLEILHDGIDCAGDGTVPRISATPIEFGEGNGAVFSHEAHASLQNHSSLLEHIEGVLTGLPPAKLASYRLAEDEPTPLDQIGLSLRVPDVLSTDDPLSIHVRPERAPRALGAYLVNVDSGEVLEVALQTIADGAYVGETRVTPGVWRVTVKGSEEVLSVSDLVAAFAPVAATAVIPSETESSAPPSGASESATMTPSPATGLPAGTSGNLEFSTDLHLAPEGALVSDVLHTLGFGRPSIKYVVLRRNVSTESLFYAYRPDELVPLLAGAADHLSAADALGLHEYMASFKIRVPQEVPVEVAPTSGVGLAAAASRLVLLDARGEPAQVGEAVGRARYWQGGDLGDIFGPGGRGGGSADEAEGGDAPAKSGPPISREPETDTRDFFDFIGGDDWLSAERGREVIPPPGSGPHGKMRVIGAVRSAVEGGSQASRQTITDDEGTTILRNPSLRPKTPAIPGKLFVVEVDLLLGASDPETQGLTMTLSGLSDDWYEEAIAVELSARELNFESGADQGTIVVVRNAASRKCTLSASVDPALALPGNEFILRAEFFHRGRFCGAARKSIRVEADGGDSVPPPKTTEAPKPTPPTRGAVAIDLATPAPRLTVTISSHDRKQPGLLAWSLNINPVTRSLARKISRRPTGTIDLGEAPKDFADRLRVQAPKVTAGLQAHFRSVGKDLWDAAPEVFRRAYAALREEEAGFAIQFITDDPYTPWELMLPDTPAGCDILALEHPTARWFLDYELDFRLMTGQLRRGKIVSIAPEYQGRQVRPLPAALDEAEHLRRTYSAHLILPANRAEVVSLLAGAIPGPIGIVHFAGHGEYQGTTGDRILLEDQDVYPNDIGGAVLGPRDQPFAVLNACQVGSAGMGLGKVGGFGAAFLKASFSGFLGPLWSVQDLPAGALLTDFLKLAVEKGEPIGSALRTVRAAHVETSPTYLAYALYGDVMARFTDGATDPTTT